MNKNPNPKCPACGQKKAVKSGTYVSLTVHAQRYHCQGCGRNFTGLLEKNHAEKK
jgi:transposase-like protein